MRTLPISLVLAEDGDGSIEAMARALTRLTHPDPVAVWCSVVYNLTVVRLLEGVSLKTAWAHAYRASLATAQVATGVRGTTVEKRIDRLRSIPENVKPNPGGYCLDTLERALWAVGGAPSAEDAIVRAARMGGDADTAAAVAGGLAGTLWGASRLPLSWLQTLDTRVRNRIETALAAVPSL